MPSNKSTLYGRHFLIFDAVIPMVIGLGLVLLIRRTAGDEGAAAAVAGNRAAVYGAVMAVGGSLIGFAITLIPLTHALLSLEGLKILRESPYVGQLFTAQIVSVLALGALTLSGMLALLFDRDNSQNVVLEYLVLVLGCVAIWELASSVRLMWLTLGFALKSYRAGYSAK